MEWRHTTSPAKVKPKQISTPRKVLRTVFRDRKGIFLIELLPLGRTIDKDVYYITWDVFDHPPYSPYLRPLVSASEVFSWRSGLTAMMSWKNVSPHGPRQRRQHSTRRVFSIKLVPRYDKHQENHRSSVEKRVRVVNFFEINLFAVSILVIFFIQNGTHFHSC